VWVKKRKPSFRDPRVARVTETILAYARQRSAAPRFIGGTTTRGKWFPLNNAGNGVRVLVFPARSVAFLFGDGRVEAQDMSQGRIRTRLLDPVVVEGGTNREPFRLEGEWRYAQETLDRLVAAGERLVIRKVPFRPNHVREGGAPKTLASLLDATRHGVGTYEDAADESRRLFGDAPFDYPKPESLLRVLIEAVTAPGDLVLDPFAGSGTTGAVAHKLSRRWVMIEAGPQCETHAAARLMRVVAGLDHGGVSGAVGWRGGGGFRFFRARQA
jgi:adenine-specific DNA-methyltransferase